MIAVREYKGLDKKKPPPGKNYLFFENSLYLKQHEDNPVMWYPWCREAFEKARMEGKLIFVSIGYSTCHWCHVMERESFSDPEIAELMNRYFISIKIDREERPDLDRIFMTICEITIQNCGWPLNIVLTPEFLPFFVSTYIPPTTRGNMLGMKELIPKIYEAWRKEESRVKDTGEKIVEIIKKLQNEISKPISVSELSEDKILYEAFESIKSVFDPEYGGFGRGMKFPNPSILLYTLRFFKRTKSEQALHIVDRTLKKMMEGGIYDHIGGGFHRYAVERTWLIPHFEKMLYDQAQMIQLYTEAYLITRNEAFKNVVFETFSYLIEKMYDEKTGCFWSAQDAESEGKEGEFYLWHYDDIKEALRDSGSKELEIITRHFGASPSGNALIFGDKNIIHISESIKKLAEIYDMEEKEVQKIVENAKHKMKEYREKKKIPPHVDKKVLTDWNSLLIIALSEASRVFRDKKMMETAKKCADFIMEKMIDGAKLYHVLYGEEKKVEGFLDDFSSFALSLIELYETTFEAKYLRKAKNLTDGIIDIFCDMEKGGFFIQGKDTDLVITRTKEIFDGATPSGNSMSVLLLAKMYRITGEKKYREIAENTIASFFDSVKSSPIHHTFILSAFDFYIGPSFEVILVGDSKDELTQFVDELWSRFIPRKIVLLNLGIDDIAPYAKNFIKKDNKPSAYVCIEGICKSPATDVKKMLENLDEINNSTETEIDKQT